MKLFNYIKFYFLQVSFLSILVFISYYGGLKNLHYIDIYPRSFDLGRFLFFIIFSTCTSIIVFLNISKFIELNIHLYIFVFLLPNFSFYVSGGGDTFYIVYFLIVSFCFLFFILYLYHIFSNISDLKNINIFNFEYLWMILILSLLLIFLNFDYFNLSYDLQSIYKNREIISKGQFVGFEYLHMILSKAILPILLVNYLSRNELTMVFICFVLFVLLFYVTQHRAVFLIPFLILFLFTFAKLNISDKIFVPAIFLIISIIGLWLHFYDITLLLGDIIIRRFFLDSAALNFAYFDFFSIHRFTFFTDSNLTLGAFDSFYDVQIPYIISNEIGAYGGHANVGFFGSGFQHAGFVGVLFYTFLISFVIVLVDYMNRKKNPYFVFSIYFISFVWIYISTDLPSIFLTHGFLFLLYFNYLLRSKL